MQNSIFWGPTVLFFQAGFFLRFRFGDRKKILRDRKYFKLWRNTV